MDQASKNMGRIARDLVSRGRLVCGASITLASAAPSAKFSTLTMTCNGKESVQVGGRFGNGKESVQAGG